MEIEDKVSTVGDENTVGSVEAFRLNIFKFIEEGGDVNDNARANEIKAFRVDEAWEIVNKGS